MGTIIAVVVSGAGLAPLARGGDYYVATNGSDSAEGTYDGPFLSLGKAAGVALQPGDTVWVRGGVYQPTQSVVITKSGHVGAPISFRAYPGEAPVVDGQNKYPGKVESIRYYRADPPAPDVTCNGVTYTNGQRFKYGWSPLFNVKASHIVIDGIGIKRSLGRAIAAVDGGTNLVVRNCTICSNLNEAVVYKGVSGFAIEGCTMWENARFAPFPRDRSILGHPLVVKLQDCQDGVVSGCDLFHNWGECVGLWCGTSNAVVEDCTIWDNYAVEVYIDKGRDCTVRRNAIYHAGNSNYFRNGLPCVGVLIGDEGEIPGDSSGFGRKILNNLFIGNGHHVGYWWSADNGRLDSRLRDEVIANNTFVGAPTKVISIANPPGTNRHENVRFSNNVFFQANGNYCTLPTTSGHVLLFSNNCFSASAPSAAMAAGAVVGDPKFVGGGQFSPESYRLARGSPCVGRGVVVGGMVADYFRRIRHSPPDIGFHELDGGVSFEEWASDHGVGGGAGGDHDRDSVANLLEFAIRGMSGTAPDAHLLPKAVAAGGVLRFGIRKNPEASLAAAYAVETSADLVHWTSLGLTIERDDADQLVVSVPCGAPARFLRLRVSLEH